MKKFLIFLVILAVAVGIGYIYFCRPFSDHPLTFQEAFSGAKTQLSQQGKQYYDEHLKSYVTDVQDSLNTMVESGVSTLKTMYNDQVDALNESIQEKTDATKEQLSQQLQAKADSIHDTVRGLKIE